MSSDFSALMGAVPVGADAKQRLAAVMQAPDRFYHDARHLSLLWRRHRRHGSAEGLAAPSIETLIACAIAYHDYVHDAGADDNEARSAEIWLGDSASAGLAAEDREWVAATILATRDHLGWRARFGGSAQAAVTDPSPEALRRRARLWLLDLDLTPLGEAAPEFERNTALLRREAGRLSDAEWERGRRAFLQRFAAVDRIFLAPTLHAAFEAQARCNIRQALAAP